MASASESMNFLPPPPTSLRGDLDSKPAGFIPLSNAAWLLMSQTTYHTQKWKSQYSTACSSEHSLADPSLTFNKVPQWTCIVYPAENTNSSEDLSLQENSQDLTKLLPIYSRSLSLPILLLACASINHSPCSQQCHSLGSILDKHNYLCLTQMQLINMEVLLYTITDQYSSYWDLSALIIERGNTERVTQLLNFKTMCLS